MAMHGTQIINDPKSSYYRCPETVDVGYKSSVNKVQIPVNVILHQVAPFISDRRTWNSLASLNRELYQLSQNLDCPWPKTRWRVAIGRQACCVSTGRRFAVCGTDQGAIQVQFCRTGKSKILRGHKGRINAIAIIDEEIVVSAGDDRIMRVWDTREWICRAELTGHTSSIIEVAGTTEVSGKSLVATASLDRIIRLYSITMDTEQMDVSCLKVFSGIHRGPVHSLSFCNGFLVSGSSDEQVLLWDIEKLALSRSLMRGEGEVRSMDAWKNKLALSCGKTIRIHDFQSGSWTVLKGYHSNVRSLAFSPDGCSIASACSDGAIRLWSLSERICAKTRKAHNDFLVCSVAFSPDGKTILSAGSDGTIASWTV